MVADKIKGWMGGILPHLKCILQTEADKTLVYSKDQGGRIVLEMIQIP